MAPCKILVPLKLFLVVVFVGWLSVWITIPTKLFVTEWLPMLDSKFNSPKYYQAREYYGKQGFFYTFLAIPMVLIAAVGCIYAHFQKKEEQDITKRKNGKKSIVSVVPALGIVTSVEFFFLLMFVVLLVWSMVNHLFSHFTSDVMLEKPHLLLWHAKFRNIAVRLGSLGNICWAFIFFPVTRGSSVLQFFGLTSESSIKYHIWLGHISTALFMAHGVLFLVYWATMLDDIQKLKTWRFAGPSTIGAEILVVIVILVWVTSQRRFRRRKFELFYYTHQLYPLYILFYMLHAGAPALSMVIPGIFLFAVDRYLRFLQSRDSVKVLSSRKLPNSFCEITFAKSPELLYQPGSILFLNVPAISKMQWHPFTVTSNCNMEPDKLSVVIGSAGSWTTRLNRHVEEDYIHASVEGPYGPNFCKFLSHEKLVFVTGGSGITPCISYFREIVFRSSQQGCRIPKVLLICSFKTTADLSLLSLLLPAGASLSDTHNVDVQIEAYITRERVAPTSPPDDDGIKTIKYKSCCFDTPVRSVLGPNSWLWLCAIIVSSFGLFLLLLAIVFRWHIRNVHYHYSLYVTWDLALMCACVFLVSSGVFLFLKNRTTSRVVHCIEELHQPQQQVSEEGDDVESFPRESMIRSTKVYYGKRPDMKKILLELEEEDVGVVACGPSQMTHDVASVCARDEATNLHFEAISFSW